LKSEDRVLTRLRPGVLGGVLVAWPANVIGKLRMVRRSEGGVIFVTQGLSFPFCRSLHPEPRAALGYELAIELAPDEPIEQSTVAQTSDAGLAMCWPVDSLWFMADVAVHEELEYARRLQQGFERRIAASTGTIANDGVGRQAKIRRRFDPS